MVESEIAKEGKEYVKISVSKHGCICSNVVGKNLSSSDSVLKYGLGMLIEGISTTFGSDARLSGGVGCVETATRTKTRLHRSGAWLDSGLVRRWMCQSSCT